MESPIKLRWFAAGTWHDPSGGQWFDSVNPTTGEVWARVPHCNKDDINFAVASAQHAFCKSEYSSMRAAERGRLLMRMSKAVRKNAEYLARTEMRDNGKLYAGILSALQGWLTDSFDYYAGLSDKLEGSVIPVDVPDVFNFTTHEPYGVVACITAWNSPLLIAIWKISAAIAAGNTVVLKPSEFASVSTLALMEALEEAELPTGLLNVVTGQGPETGRTLVRHHDVALVSFTGGITGGSAVAKSAAESVTPTILELGGKSPQLVLPDADLDLAARGIVSGIFPSAGQSCIAGSRVLVPNALYDDLVQRLIKISRKARLGDPSSANTHIGPISHKAHFDQVLAAINNARLSGAECVLGGRAASPDGCNGWFIEPTIFTHVDAGSELAQKEVFGPVLAILSYDNEEHAIELANAGNFGLAAGIWSRDSMRALRLAGKIKSGTVYINNYFLSAPQSPVGGFKQSGYGRESGIEGLLAFRQTRSVWLATKPAEKDPFA